jgi:hypothetical protein
MYFHYESSLKIVGMPELGPANHVARLVRYGAVGLGLCVGRKQGPPHAQEGRRFTYEKTRGNGWHASLGLDAGLTRQLTANLDVDCLKLDTSGSHRWVNTVFGEDMNSDYEGQCLVAAVRHHDGP